MAGKVFDPISRTLNAVTASSANNNFIAYATAALTRGLSVATSYVKPGNTVTVPIILNSFGNEKTVAFSLSNEFYLFNPTVACGSSDPGCTITTTGGGNSGALGVTVTPASQLAAGPREIARVTYQTLGNISQTIPNSPITFTDSPTARLTTNATNDPLLTTYTNGLVIFAQGLEGDVAGRFAGDGQLLANDVSILRQFVVGNLAPNPLFNEFQRADVAPRGSFGDGQINAGDITQERRYVAGLDAPSSANGPGEMLASPSVCNQSFDSVVAPALPTGWSSSATGAESPWTTTTVGPDSGPNAAFAPDPASVGNTELISPVMNIPSGGNPITFRNAFDLEQSFDGMVLEISINGGAYQDILAAGGSFASGGYNGTISLGSSPIAGRSAWTGSTGTNAGNPNYITTTVNLPASANGQEIRLKWRVATDVSVSGVGARIDNVTNGACSLALSRVRFEDVKRRQVSATASEIVGGKVTVAIDMNTRGTEAAASFTLNFNPRMLANPQVSLASGVTEDGALTTNLSKAEAGKIGILVDSTQPFIGRELVNVTFDVVEGAGGTSAIYFSDDLARRGVADIDGNMVDTGYGSTKVSLGSGGSAGLTEVTGRLVSSDGVGLRNIVVVLADAEGNVRTATTSSFGYFSFAGVPMGDDYTISVQSKRYHFESRSIAARGGLADIELVAR
jgi:hypothetical protein